MLERVDALDAEAPVRGLELLAITPPAEAVEPALVEAWLEAGVTRVRFGLLLREPGRRPAALVRGRLRSLAWRAREAGLTTLLSVDSEHVDEAAAVLAGESLQGVQLRGDPGERALARARASVGEAILGRSCHGTPTPGYGLVDYTCVAPVFTPRTGPAHAKPAAGLALVTAWARAEPGFVVALGGIGPGNAAACLQAGARGLAAISTFLGPTARVVDHVRALVHALEAARHVSPPR